MGRRDLLKVLGVGSVAQVARRLALAAMGGVKAGGEVAPEVGKTPDVELALTAAPGEVSLLPGPPTRVWRFTARLLRGPISTLQSLPDSYLGPVIRLRRGQRVRLRFSNELGEPSIVHWHGLDVPEQADGHPRLAVESGKEYIYTFEVTNRAGTYWYHPHPHMRTAAQVYQGLAGLLLVSDPEEEAVGLPSGRGELLAVLQDRRMDSRNQLVYPASAGMGMGLPGRRGGMGAMMELMNGWLGDRILVNGRVQPVLQVDRRTYRVRLLNGSNARFYKLAWSDDSPLVVIGGDGGLLERPRRQRAVTLAPAQRVDLILDLSSHSAGSELQLVSLPFPAEDVGRVGMMDAGAVVPQGAPLTLMTLRLSDVQGPSFKVPERLSTDDWQRKTDAAIRRVPLTFMRMNWLIDGRTFEGNETTTAEIVKPGSTHIWEFINRPNPMGMAIAHPMHVHGPQFRVLSRSGASANALQEGFNDAGWTDTVVVLPGETVRVQITFSKYPGLYLYHCHILEHEDMGMMRNFRIATNQ